MDGERMDCLKIFGFRHPLRRICLFVSTVYASFWFAAPQAASALVIDLLMLQLIEDFAQVDRKLDGVAEKKIRLHLWYQSENLAILSLFRGDISADNKEAIINALQ